MVWSHDYRVLRTRHITRSTRNHCHDTCTVSSPCRYAVLSSLTPLGQSVPDGVRAPTAKVLNKFKAYIYTNDDNMFCESEPFAFTVDGSAGQSGGASDDEVGRVQDDDDETVVDLTVVPRRATRAATQVDTVDAAKRAVPGQVDHRLVGAATQVDIVDAVKSAVLAQMDVIRQSLVPVPAPAKAEPSVPVPVAASSPALRDDRGVDEWRTSSSHTRDPTHADGRRPPYNAGRGESLANGGAGFQSSADVHRADMVNSMRAAVTEVLGAPVASGVPGIGAVIDKIHDEVKAVKQSLGSGLDRLKEVDALQRQIAGLRDIANRTYQSATMTAMVTAVGAQRGGAHMAQSVAERHRAHGADQRGDEVPRGGHARWDHPGRADDQYIDRSYPEDDCVDDRVHYRRESYDHVPDRRRVSLEQRRVLPDATVYERDAYDERLHQRHVRLPRHDDSLGLGALSPGDPFRDQQPRYTRLPLRMQGRVVHDRGPQYDDYESDYGRETHASNLRRGGQGGHFVVPQPGTAQRRRSPPRSSEMVNYFNPGW